VLIFECIDRECVLDDCPSIAVKLSKNAPDDSNKVQEKVSFCLNTCIQRKRYPKCEVFSAGDCGHGLRVCSDVPSGTLLIEYTGEVITTSECNDRMRGMRGDQCSDDLQMFPSSLFGFSLF
jgi:hypothetical protein